MTSANSFCKLLWEDVKRRAWAAALLVMIFFFALPVHLSLILENAENTRYYQYNNWEPLVLDGTISQAEYEARVLACKTEAVAGELQFGNGLTAFLMIAAAVVVGAASFSYLHNRRKTDFYHSIPVRREMLFGAAFAGGILLVAAAYLLNLCLAAAVAGSAGVGIGSLAGPMVRGYFLNLLYFGLNYAVVTAAMMLTGHTVVGILATGVLFFFMPCVMVVLESYCNTFFITATGSSWGSMRMIFDVGERYLSPVAAYVTAIGWESAGEGGAHIAEQIIALFAFFGSYLVLPPTLPPAAIGGGGAGHGLSQNHGAHPDSSGSGLRPGGRPVFLGPAEPAEMGAFRSGHGSGAEPLRDRDHLSL